MYDEQGILFPANDKGTRSSSDFGKLVLSQSLVGINDELKQAILKEKNWRYNYAQYFVEMVKTSLQSPEIAGTVADNALKTLYETVEYKRGIYTFPLAKLYKKEIIEKLAKKDLLSSFQCHGHGAMESRFEFTYHGNDLVDEIAMAQIKKWGAIGTISEDTEAAFETVFKNQSKFLSQESLENCIFVTLGASSEMGPFHHLLRLGATVVAVDLPNKPELWKKLIGYAEKHSKGTLIVPYRKSQEDNLIDVAQCGCDLLTETPEIMHWLLNLLTEDRFKTKKVVVGSYTYLASELFPKITIACDLISSYLQEHREAETIIATLSSGADVFVVPREAVDKANARMDSLFRKVVHGSVNTLSMGKFLQPNKHMKVVDEQGNEFFICDGLATIQGPNYALAKRIQHWRATLCVTQDRKVSSNIAPATFTNSVEREKITYYISRAIGNFEPIEVFEKDTTKALMTYLLLFDVFAGSEGSASKIRNPLEIVSATAIDCGVWRAAAKIGSSGEVAVMMYFLGAALEKVGLPSFLQNPSRSKL